MTAVLSHLDGWDIAAIVAGSWIVLACVGTASWALVATRLKRKPKPEHVNWLALLPPVPPPAPRITQAEVDETWLDAWPTHVERSDIDQLEQRVYDRLFFDQIACEGLS